MSIINDFKYAFRKRNNGLIQIILINMIVFVVVLLINVIFYLTANKGLFHFIGDNLSIPANFNEFIYKPWTLITYFFTHFDPFHILFNMLGLYWFGKLIGEYLGNRHLVALYILGGLFSGLFFLLLSNTIPAFYSSNSMIGASGAVYAVVLGAATLIPDYTFFVFLLGPVKIKYIAAFFIVITFFEISIGSNLGGNLAHLGGALFGYIYISRLKKGNDWSLYFIKFFDWIKKLFKAKPKMKVTYRNQQGPSSTPSTPSEEEIDKILDKITKSGYESLSKDEKQKLFHASQKN